MILTLDVGTTAVKAGLFDERLQLQNLWIEEYELLYGEAGKVEMRPETYWEKAVLAVRGVLRGRESEAERIRAVTCTTQGETLIPINREGKPLGNAVVWLDSRAEREAEQLKREMDPLLFYRKTGQPEPTGAMPLCKLLWIKQNKRELYEKTWKFMLLEDYLIWKLCKKVCTNPSLMSSTGYFELEKGELWQQALECGEVDKEKIPECLPCGTSLGRIDGETARELGISKEARIVTGAMDQTASAIGAGNLEPGLLMETTGTCQTVLGVCKEMQVSELSPVTCYCHGMPGRYLKLLYNETAGMALKWFRREFCQDLKGDDIYEQMNVLAEREPVGSRGVFFYPHMAGALTPKVNPQMRGAFVGAGLDSTRGAFIRALMEGVGYMLRQDLEIMAEQPERIISLGGGAKSPVWCQIKAEICGVPVAVRRQTESTSLGAAILGGVGTGIFASVENAAKAVQEGRSFDPVHEHIGLYEQGYKVYKKMYGALEQLFEKGGVEK